MGAGGEGVNRWLDGWMASPTRCAWVWVDSRRLWWTGRPGVLRFIGSQRIGHDWATELNWTELNWTWVHKMNGEKTDSINQWLRRYAPSLEHSHPGEEGKIINISLGYDVLPLPGPRKIMRKCHPTNLGFLPASKRTLAHIAALFLPMNHVYYWNFRERVRERIKNIIYYAT